VVALKVSAVRSFDTSPAGVSQATGFVVDAKRGIILTNRHVVQPGPVDAEAVFLNHERVDVEAIYRDPVHDFGFFRYDPSSVQFMKPTELALAPGVARVGLDVRIVGNDSGEKLSILAGTLARLDREAPKYGRGRYGDFNTFYLQAASSSSGGSSGSPVVDVRGRVIALNAGGNRQSASSFFLPLDRVARALARIQAGEPVARGTLQTIFVRESFDELERLGLRKETEAAARRRYGEAVGLLVVREIVPGGPADGLLREGDILVEADGRTLDGFVALEALLDERVGQTVSLAVERGGEPLVLDVPVGDLHAVTPSAYLEFGGAVLHDFSYQLARSYAVPTGGVYVAAPGYSFRRSNIPGGVIVTHLADAPVAQLDEFETRLAGFAHGSHVRVRYFHPARPTAPQAGVLHVDRRWYPMRVCRRDDAHGRFDCVASPEPGPPEPLSPVSARLEAEGPAPIPRLARSIATVAFEVPYVIDGVQGTSFRGAGVVLDAERGLVVTDRDTVPVALGDVEIVFGGTVEVPGHVVAIHPEHNVAIVGYDPALLGDTPVEAARLSDDPLRPGDEVHQVVLTARQQLLSRTSTVERIDAPSLPIPSTPRFREANVDLVALTDTLEGIGGVLADRKGRVKAFWASFSADQEGKPTSFFAGIPTDALRAWLAAIQAGANLRWHTLGVELAPLPLSAARDRGLPDALARELEADAPARPRALAVRRLTHGMPAAEQLQVGDLVVRVDGAMATDFLALERAAQTGSITLTIVRAGSPLEVSFATPQVEEVHTERVLLWSGAILHAVPSTLARQRGLPRSGVYVAGRWRGGPADRYGLRPTRRILAVDERPTADLDAFLEALASSRGERGSVRLRVAELDGRIRVLTLVPDPLYWPTQELLQDGAGWRRVPLDLAHPGAQGGAPQARALAP
jgi:S1-C subfamily serine protease